MAAPNQETSPSGSSSAAPSRFRIGVNVLIQLVLLFVIFAVVNYLSFRHHRQWDLTQNRKFTLSSTTLNFLNSLDQNVEIVVAFLAGSVIYDDIKGLIDEYQRHGNTRIDVEMLDPGRDRARAKDIKNQYNLELSRNSVIISAGDITRVVTEEEMVLREDGGTGRIKEFRGEAALTSALIAAVEKARKKLYLISGHRKVTELQAVMQALHGLVSQQNVEVQELLFSKAESIPEDCEALLLIGPAVDLSAREIEMLRTYWEERKGSLLILLNPSAETPNLHAFLARYGVTPRADRILYAASVSGMELQKTYHVPAVFLPGSPVTRELMGVNTVLLEETQSLRLLENDPLLQAEGITIIPLLLADDRFWGETRFREEKVARNDPGDNLPPLYIAASIEKGGADDARLRIESSRLIVAGNSHFLDAEPQRIKQNYDFVLSSINWLLDREELIGITPRQPSEYSLNLSPKQFSRIQLMVLVIMPVGVFLFGLTVWGARRQ